MDTPPETGTAGRPSDKPTVLYVATPADFARQGITPRQAERQLARYMREVHPPAFSHEDEAEAEALMAASSADDLQSWAQALGAHLGMSGAELEELRLTVLPRSFAYVVKLQFYDVAIEAVDDDDWRARLDSEADLLWMPDHLTLYEDGEAPRRRFRVVTSRDLLGSFGIIKATKIYARSRPRL